MAEQLPAGALGIVICEKPRKFREFSVFNSVLDWLVTWLVIFDKIYLLKFSRLSEVNPKKKSGSQSELIIQLTKYTLFVKTVNNLTRSMRFTGRSPIKHIQMQTGQSQYQTVVYGPSSLTIISSKLRFGEYILIFWYISLPVEVIQ